jgi:hypothetical protein
MSANTRKYLITAIEGLLVESLFSICLVLLLQLA